MTVTGATPQADLDPHPAPVTPVEVVRADFDALNALIPRRLTSDVNLVTEIGDYIVSAGGKRLRPLIVLLAANACGCERSDRIKLAAVIEFLHTATLLHDDVVDASHLRRGRATANELWGNAPSVLVGDFLYSRAFQMMVEIGDLKIMRILSDATNVIAEGEVMQLDSIGAVDIGEARYREVIRCKTATLFEAASHTAAVLSGCDAGGRSALADYGLQLGFAFQLVDDALDYAGSVDQLGKNVGDDLAEGKVTLPLIHAMRTGSAGESAEVRRAILERDAAAFSNVLEIVRDSGAIEYTMAQARDAALAARANLTNLSETRFRAALEHLCDFAVERDH